MQVPVCTAANRHNTKFDGLNQHLTLPYHCHNPGTTARRQPHPPAGRHSQAATCHAHQRDNWHPVVQCRSEHDREEMITRRSTARAHTGHLYTAACCFISSDCPLGLTSQCALSGGLGGMLCTVRAAAELQHDYCNSSSSDNLASRAANVHFPFIVAGGSAGASQAPMMQPTHKTELCSTTIDTCAHLPQGLRSYSKSHKDDAGKQAGTV
jgi:hypothetical protein